MDVPRICIVVRRIYLQTYKTKPDGNANLGQPGILSKISLDNYSSLLHSGLSLPLDASPRRSRTGTVVTLDRLCLLEVGSEAGSTPSKLYHYAPENWGTSNGRGPLREENLAL
ncbi:hypothetical protein HL42_6133 [Trichophyton rubrum]|nr:hypothetical protein HL42_6133 [Trichophyton rubrum]